MLRLDLHVHTSGEGIGNLRGRMRCLNCGYEAELDQRLLICPRCGGLMEIEVEPLKAFSPSELKGRGVWRYKQLIPGNYPELVTLGEGNTPLVRAREFNLYFKVEGSNPTGSFKDRGMTVAVSSALNLGYRIVTAASTGNTSASAAAYGARAGLKTMVILPKEKVALGKLAQAILFGATVVEVEGNFDVALQAVMKTYMSSGLVYPLNSFNPWRLEGQKTIAFEIFEEIGVPDTVLVPVGNAGNIYAIWKGFHELREHGVTESVPRMIGVQAEGASPLAKAMIKREEVPVFTDNPETIATAIRIGKPVNWKKAFKAVKESGGTITTVTDDEILNAQRALARINGLGVEPASAASYAGYLKLLQARIIDKGETSVAILTGHALKDPSSMMLAQSVRISVKPEEIQKVIEGEIRSGNSS